MNSLLLFLLILGVGLIIYCTALLTCIKSDIDMIKNYANHIYRILPSIYWFSETGHKLDTLKDDLESVEKNLTTEIACLATKNNEDIKRMGGKFEEWDLIDLDENEVLIYSAKPNANGQMVFHCVDKAGKMYTFFGSDKLNDAKFLRHTSSPFEE